MSKPDLNGSVANFANALGTLLEKQIEVTDDRVSEELDKKLFKLKTDLEGKLLPIQTDIDGILSKISKS